MSDQVSKSMNGLKSFVHATNLDEFIKVDTESEKALTKVKTKARQLESDTVAEFKQKRVRKAGTKRVTVDVPEDLHSEFKILVIKIGTDMNAFLLRVIEKSVASEIDK